MIKLNKTFFFSSILLFLANFSCSPPQDIDVSMNIGDNNILKYPIHQKTISNGLQIVTVPFDSPGLVSFYIVVRVGSRNEVQKGVTGFAHFFEHMMFRGTEKYPREKYKNILKSIGAGANAYTSNDRTVYHMTGNSEKLELMFEIEADRFRNLSYSEHDFKTEAGAVKGEYTKNYSSPYNRLYERILFSAFDVHTYKHSTMGFFEDIVDMPNQYDYSLTFFDRFYRPEHTTIVVVGDVTSSLVNKLANDHFGSWIEGSYLSDVPIEPKQNSTRFVHLQDPSVPPFLSMHYKGPAFSDKSMDMPTLDVISTVVFSENSQLYKKLVIDEQKARFIGGGAYDSRDPNLFSIQVSLFQSEDMVYVRDEINKALGIIKNSGIDAKSLADTKSHLKYSFAMNIDNPTTIANSLSHYIGLTGDPETINNVYALYDKVTIEDVKRVANSYFISTGLTYGTISSHEESDFK